MTKSDPAAALEDLSVRVGRLERERFKCPNDGVEVDEAMRRARLAVERSRSFSAVWRWVPPPYYTWPLDERAKYLGARSPHHLCKSLLMENRKAPGGPGNGAGDPTNPKFVLVVVQYASTLDVKKLTNAIRSLRKDVKKRLDPSQFDFRVASKEDNDAVTGFSHNSVTPFGLLRPEGVRIVLADAIVPLRFFFMGGGHEHLKLAMAVPDFVDALDPIVADISVPRTSMTIEDLKD